MNAKLLEIVTVLSSGGTENITLLDGFGAFAFFKPLADVIQKSPLSELSQPINVLLGALDIFVILGIVATFGVLFFGLLKFHFKGAKGKDETVDMKQVEAERKQDLKRLVKSVIGLSIIFIFLPVIITIVCAIIGAFF